MRLGETKNHHCPVPGVVVDAATKFTDRPGTNLVKRVLQVADVFRVEPGQKLRRPDKIVAQRSDLTSLRGGRCSQSFLRTN